MLTASKAREYSAEPTNLQQELIRQILTAACEGADEVALIIRSDDDRDYAEKLATDVGYNVTVHGEILHIKWRETT